MITAFSYLAEIPRTWLPMVMNGDMPKLMSNSDLRRLLDSGGILINGKKPKSVETVEFPVTELVFFPKSRRRTTMIQEGGAA